MKDHSFIIGHTISGFTPDEVFTTTEAGGRYIDKLLAYKPIFRISQHREPGEEPPHTWMIPSYEIYTGHPTWEEDNEHFRVRVKEGGGYEDNI